MASLKRMLSHGYFPFEVPQAFSSRSFARVASATNAPPELLLTKEGKYRHAELAKHNLARKGKLRRVLGIPNPLLHLNMSREIANGWPEIEQALDRSKLTATRIMVERSGYRALAPEHGPPDFPRLRARHRTNKKYLLVADILQFYPSVYTHSIPWALHGKPAGKAGKDDWSLLGNRLDFWVRQAQDRQTRGVPIGPDSSRLIAEIVLAAVDEQLMKRFPRLQGFRALDDYELSFRSRSEAESALAELQTILAEFELQLSESKTVILELPLGLESVWPAPLRDYEFAKGAPRTIIRSLAEFFSLAFQIARENPSENVLKYALARAGNEDWSGVAWLTYQDLLLQCATAEPGVLKHVTAELKKYQMAKQKLDRARITDLVENTVRDHVPLGHGSEVAWAIWLSITLGLRLTDETAKLISGSEDPLVPLLALHARERKLVGTMLDTSTWQHHMSLEGLRGPHWLLAYEAGVRKWLPSNSAKKHHVDQDPSFKYLKAMKVRFYNRGASARTLTRWRPRMSVSQVIGYGLE